MALEVIPGYVPPTPPFNWTYSKIKNFETCPKRCYHIDIIKDPACVGGDTTSLDEGNAVHKAIADAISGKAALPKHRQYLQFWVDYAKSFPGKLEVEQKLAITKDFTPCGYFDKGDKGVWHRSVGDVIGIHGPVGVVLDWKTGKPKDDDMQLSVIGACLFARDPALMAIRAEFVWLEHGARSKIHLHRHQLPSLWNAMLPRVNSFKNAIDTNSWPAKPGGLCSRYCAVKSCPHNGGE